MEIYFVKTIIAPVQYSSLLVDATFMRLECLTCVKDFTTILIRAIIGECVREVFGLDMISNMASVMTVVFTNRTLHSSSFEIFLDKLI